MDPSTARVPAYYQWTPEQVNSWLVDAGLGRYRDLIAKLQVDGKMLHCLNSSDLRRMGVSDWNSCKKLEEAVDQLTQRKVELRKEDYAFLPFPDYPGLFFDDEPQLVITSRDEQNLESYREPSRRNVYRHVYNTGGDRFFYFDHNKVLSKSY